MRWEASLLNRSLTREMWDGLLQLGRLQVIESDLASVTPIAHVASIYSPLIVMACQ